MIPLVIMSGKSSKAMAPISRTTRALSTSTSKTYTPRRAMLYVPGSNPRMLAKSLKSPADSIAYDLEDSVAVGKKGEARRLVCDFLESGERPRGEVMVRINAIGSGFEEDDMDDILRARNVQAIALPKTSSPDHISYLISRINQLCPSEKQKGKEGAIKIIGMIENAIGMVRVEEIARSGKGYLDALLFAAEDYCADVGLTRTASRSELLYPRSRLVTAAKAYGLQAIDLVCVNYKDPEILRDESAEGRRLGFDGKQAIHPDQVEIIHRAFSPSNSEIVKATRIKEAYERHDKDGRGAFELDGAMIDAPVYKQAVKVLSRVRA